MDIEEAQVLADLRRAPDWPGGELDALARQAAEAGRLREAVENAGPRSREDVGTSSNSSGAIHPARVPIYFSNLPNDSATFYSRLKQELHRRLGVAGGRSVWG
jgi:hypothetical protein